MRIARSGIAIGATEGGIAMGAAKKESIATGAAENYDGTAVEVNINNQRGLGRMHGLRQASMGSGEFVAGVRRFSLGNS